MGKSSAPPAPDYTAAAQATSAGNLDAARLTAKANRVNYNTPYGNLSYTQDPNDQDQWTANVGLSQDQQGLLDQQNRTSANLGNLQDAATARVGQTMGQAIPGAYDPTQATNTAYQSLTARLDPTYARQGEQLDAQLANQGITAGSDAYKNAQTDFSQQKNDAYNQAALQSINLGMQQQGQTYNQATANRNIPINELNAIRTGSQVTNPTFGSSAQQANVAGTDYLGAANSQYNAAVNATNANNANSAGMFGGLTSLGGLGIKAAGVPSIAAMFSDRRLKRCIRRIGTYNGHNVYIYMKFGKPEIGVIAQEVMQTNPEAVTTHDSGFLMVNYGKL